jgi:NAD(P)-dependent dehydrogenase (short-subunit alcohol dehydrogenase family)
MDLNLRGKTALVTGPAKGIGKAVALGLAEEGVRVALDSRRKVALFATASEIQTATGAKGGVSLKREKTLSASWEGGRWILDKGGEGNRELIFEGK